MTGDKDMDTCDHKGTCEQFSDHTAAMIVAVATAAHPNDPVAAISVALRAVDWAKSIGTHRLMDTSDLDPETGEEFGAGPDYDSETETADEASQELADQEADER